MCRAVTMRRQRNRHYFNEFNQNLEGKKNLICRRLSKKNFHQEISCRNGKEIRPKSVRHRCMCSPCREMFSLLTLRDGPKKSDGGGAKVKRNFFPRKLLIKKYIPTDFGQKNMPKEDLCRQDYYRLYITT